MRTSFASTTDALLRQAVEAEDWPAVEERVRQLLFEKPEEFWNLAKLQHIYRTDRVPSLREILGQVFGLIHGIPTRAQLADEAFEKYLTCQPANAVHSRELGIVFIAFVLDPICRGFLLKGSFAELRAKDASLYAALTRLTAEERAALIRYLETEVPLKDFELAA